MGLLDHWNAALRYVDPDTAGTITVLLPAPLFDIRPRVVERRYVEESLDRTVRNVVTVGDPVYEIIARLRFLDAADDVLTMLRHAANGVELTYIADVTDPESDTWDATFLWDEDEIELVLDADMGKIGRHEFTLTLRRPTPWAGLL